MRLAAHEGVPISKPSASPECERNYHNNASAFALAATKTHITLRRPFSRDEQIAKSDGYRGDRQGCVRTHIE
jgi:hypothetical protein